MDTHPQLPQLSRDELLQLCPADRIPYVEQIRVVYPRWSEILKAIAECHNRQWYAAEPPCILILGPTGAGKTKLCEFYERDYPPIKTEFGKKITVLSGSIPSSATISTLLTELLQAMGDPCADRGTIGGKTIRLRNLIRDCGVQLFILDELQHFVDQDSQRVLLNVSNWLKALIKDTKVACVLCGLQGEAEHVVTANPQLARLFGDPQILHPFQWDHLKPQTIEEFQKFLLQLQSLLPLREADRSQLAVANRALRCFVATDGLMAHIMKLIRRATELALLQGQEYLTDELLSKAFMMYLAPERRGISNPFIGDEPFLQVTKQQASKSKIEKPKTNRRGRRRKPRIKKIRDLVED